jgi:hypothetical protein
VIGADEPAPARTARFAGDLAGAMAAYIVKAAQHVVFAAHSDDAVAENVEREIVAGIGRIVDVAHDVPGLRENLFALDLEEALVGVEPGGERHRRHAGSLTTRLVNGRVATRTATLNG